MARPDLPFVSMLTDAEISQAICDYAARKQMGIDPTVHDIEFKVGFRQVIDGQAGTRLFASISITGVEPKTPPPQGTGA